MENIEVLMDEYKIVTSRIETFLKAQFSIYWQGLALFFGLLTIFNETRRYEILVFLPFVSITYLALVLYHYQRTLVNQEYKLYVEEKINKICSEKLIFYTEIGYKIIERKNYFVYFNWFSYFIMMISSIYLYNDVCSKHGNEIYFSKNNLLAIHFLLICFLIFFIFAVISMIKTVRKVRRVYIPQILLSN